jgi:hypothetical protein
MIGVPPLSAPLTQGDMLEECPLVGLEVGEPPADLRAIPIQRWLARIIVLSQACDLAQAKTTHVLVAPVHKAQHLVDQGVMKAASVRDQIRRHLVYGWYFLPTVAAPTEFPESLVDLRDLHVVPRAVLEALVNRGKRLASLLSPYR